MKIKTDINNWKDYLERKFSDLTIYTILNKTDVLTNGVCKITAKGSETEIDFIWPDNDWLTLDDIQFHNPNVNAWSGELLGGNNPKLGKFNQDNIDYVNQILEVPLRKGWTSTEYYFFGKIFKCVSKEGIDPNTGKELMTDYKASCIGVILFPIRFLIVFGISNGIIGKIKVSVVEPMIK